MSRKKCNIREESFDMKTIILEKEVCLQQAADRITALLAKKPDAVLAFSTGRTMGDLFAVLAARCAEGALSLKDARIFAVTEFENVEEEQSARGQLLRELAGRTDLREENCHFLSVETAEDYDAQIARCGGLDMAVLGLGVNAHVGYNEPAVPFDSLTHRQKLTDKTRAQLASSFSSAEAAPAYAWTMGIKTLVAARQILVLAFGEEKAWAVFQMLYARDDSVIPAAFLQLPPEVMVFVDPAAAAKL